MPEPSDKLLQFLEDAFERNLTRLEAEGAPRMPADVRRRAWEEVVLYWTKLRTLAERVTNAEVPVVLPLQQSPEGRTFSLMGVVDLIEEDDVVWMYDLKTQDAAAIRRDPEMYREQLGVYAHLLSQLIGKPIQGAEIIATNPPDSLHEAFNSGDATRLRQEIEQWEPLIPVDLSELTVQNVLDKFGCVVDAIEQHKFSPPPVTTLEKMADNRRDMAHYVCMHCDARFSCRSFLAYADIHFKGPQREALDPFISISEVFEDSGLGLWLDDVDDAALDGDEQ